MKKTIVAMTLYGLIQVSALCFEEVRLTQFSAQLEEGAGRISAGNFSYRDAFLSLEAQDLDQDFGLKNSLLNLNLSGLEINYQMSPEGLVSKIQSLQTQDLNLHYIPNQKLSLSTSGVTMGHSGGAQFIPQIEVECKRTNTKGPLNDLINPCLELGRVEIPILDFDQLSSQAVSKALTGAKSSKGIEKIEEVSLLIFNGNFQLSFKAKFLFRLKVKAQGVISHNQNDGTIDLHLNKAKVGIFSIKKTLLKELREANITGVRVVGDHLIFKI